MKKILTYLLLLIGVTAQAQFVKEPDKILIGTDTTRVIETNLGFEYPTESPSNLLYKNTFKYHEAGQVPRGMHINSGTFTVAESATAILDLPAGTRYLACGGDGSVSINIGTSLLSKDAIIYYYNGSSWSKKEGNLSYLIGDLSWLGFSKNSLVVTLTSGQSIANVIVKSGEQVDLYNDDADALFSRMEAQLTNAEKTLISDMIDSLQSNAIWESLDALYLTSMPTQQQATLNWVRDSFNLTPVGAPTFTAYYGFTGATDKYLNTGFTPNLDGINYTRNSASFGIGIDSIGGLNAYHGARNNPAGRMIYINPVTAGNTISRINSSTTLSTANTRLNEIFIVNRLLSTEQELYIGKTRYSNSANSTTLVEYEIFLLAMNSSGTAGSFSTNNINFAFMGGGLSQAKIEKLNDLVDWFNVEMRMLGLLAASSSSARTFLLQASLSGGDKTVTLPVIDTLKLSSTILLDSRTTLNCGNTVIKKDASYCNAFLNRGALSKKKNTAITLNNMTLVTNGTTAPPTLVYGLRGHLGFYFVDNLTINNFECRDGADYNFMIQLSNWSNVLIDGLIVESDKDALFIESGYNGVFRDAYLETEDDAAYIGGIGFTDYIGDCHDIEFINYNWYDSTGTYVSRGCFVMLQSWADWAADSAYVYGDMCLNGGRAYECLAAIGDTMIAANAPTHESGTFEGADGILWGALDTCSRYNADVYNVSFDSCSYYGPSAFLYFSKQRTTAYRNIYPGTETLAKAYNFDIDNTSISKCQAYLLDVNVYDVRTTNCTYDSLTYFLTNTSGGLVSDSTDFVSESNTFTNLSQNFIYTYNKRIVFTSTNDTYSNSIFANPVYGPPTSTGYLRVINNQTLPFNTLANLSPLTGDICRDLTGVKQWDGDSWETYP